MQHEMRRYSKPCLEIGCPFPAVYRGRCGSCASEYEGQRGTRAERGYDNDWLTRVAQAVKAQPWCSDCGATEDLTGDHPIPLAQGGSKDQQPIVRCRSCNSRKGARLGV